MRARSQAGFKAIDLVIVVSLIGVIAAIVMPNMIGLARNAKEAAVKANMHTVQVALEDFSIQNESFYPTSPTDALPDGRVLRDLCPAREYPANPFAGVPTVVQFNADPTPGEPGEMGVNPAEASFYVLKANSGLGELLRLTLSSGR